MGGSLGQHWREGEGLLSLLRPVLSRFCLAGFSPPSLECESPNVIALSLIPDYQLFRDLWKPGSVMFSNERVHAFETVSVPECGRHSMEKTTWLGINALFVR